MAGQEKVLFRKCVRIYVCLLQNTSNVHFIGASILWLFYSV